MGLCPSGEVSGRMRWRSPGGMHGNKSWAGVGGRDSGEKGGGCLVSDWVMTTH